MAFWPDVTAGEPVRNHAALENNLRHMVNELNGFGDNSPRATFGGVVRLQVWNATDAVIKAGSPVAFDGGLEMVNGAVPVCRVTDAAKPYGVLQGTLAKKGIGGCIVAGPAVVNVSGGSGDFAEPVPNGDGFTLSGGGAARVIFNMGGRALVLIGIGTSEMYDGPFALRYDSTSQKLHVNAGYASLNGEWHEVAAADIDPQSGHVCIYSEIGEDGLWSAPVPVIGQPGQFRYPVGKVAVAGSGDGITVAVTQYRVPVAVILDAAECPISAAQYEAEDNG